MAVVVGRAGEIMPAGELRGVLGRIDQGQRKQGLDDTKVKRKAPSQGLSYLF